MLTITAIFLIIPIVIYSSFKEILETLNGKLSIALVATQIYMIFIMPLNELHINDFRTTFFTLVGIISTIFVISLMSFDVFLTLKHFRNPQYQWKYFKYFVVLLVIFIIIGFLLYGLNFKFELRHSISSFIELILFLSSILIIVGILALIGSIYYLITLKKSTTLYDNTRYDMEKDR